MPASAVGRSGRRQRRSARPATWKSPARAERFSSTSMPAPVSARHISSPACFQSWLPSTANTPSGARRAPSSRAMSLRRHAPAPQRVRVDVVAEQEHHVGRLVVEPLDARAIAFGPACAAPAWMSDSTPSRTPSSDDGQRGSSSRAADGDEPPRLDPAGPGERRGGRQRRDRPHSAASTSSRRGMPARAPATRVDSAAAAMANRAASRSGRPAASSAASAPLTASPAPVVSTTSTAERRQPLEPRRRAAARPRRRA